MKGGGAYHEPWRCAVLASLVLCVLFTAYQKRNHEEKIDLKELHRKPRGCLCGETGKSLESGGFM